MLVKSKSCSIVHEQLRASQLTATMLQGAVQTNIVNITGMRRWAVDNITNVIL
jgi:hypothetical protein